MAIVYGANYGRPTLDLNFARNKSLIDTVSGQNLVTFTRSSTGTYVDSDGLIKTASSNTPRFDHDPLTGVCNGLLIEESRTNLITYSDYFTGWSFTSASVTTRFTIIPDQYVSPDNTISADFIRETTANGPGYYQRTLSISAGSYFSISCYVYGVGNYASNTSRRVILGLFETSSSTSVDGYTVAFNLFSSTVTSSRLGKPIWDGGTGTSAVFTETGSRITNVGNGWRRIEVYGKCSVNNPIIIFTTLNRELNSGDNDGGGTFSMTGDGSSGIGVWGFQAEVGSFTTSYIPTGASTVTRTADNAEITGTNFSRWYNQSEGTVFHSGRYIGDVSGGFYGVGNSLIFTFSNSTLNTFTNQWSLGIHKAAGPSNPSSLSDVVFNGTTPAFSGVADQLANNPVGSQMKSAAFIKTSTGEFGQVLNGGTIRSNSTTSIPTWNQLSISTAYNGQSRCGHISRFTYYPTRLQNFQLQQLTK